MSTAFDFLGVVPVVVRHCNNLVVVEQGIPRMPWSAGTAVAFLAVEAVAFSLLNQIQVDIDNESNWK